MNAENRRRLTDTGQPVADARLRLAILSAEGWRREQRKEALKNKARQVWRAVYQHPSGRDIASKESYEQFRAEAKYYGVSEVVPEKITTIEERKIRVCTILSEHGPVGLKGRDLQELLQQWNDPSFQNIKLKGPAVWGRYLNLSEEKISTLNKHRKVYNMSVNAHYLSLMDFENPDADGLRMVFLPYDMGIPIDLTGQKVIPTSETSLDISPHLTQHYDLTARAEVNNPRICVAACSYCQREYNAMDPKLMESSDDPTAGLKQRDIGNANKPEERQKIVNELIMNAPFIQDLLLTGGDALRLTDDALFDLLEKIFTQVPSFQRKGTVRLCTKELSVNPWYCQRPEFLERLAEFNKKYPNRLYMVTQFVDPVEVTPAVGDATKALKDAGIARILNQPVLLHRVNDGLDVDENGNKYPGKYAQLLLSLGAIGIEPHHTFAPKGPPYSIPYSPGLLRMREIDHAIRGSLPGTYIGDMIVSDPDTSEKIPVGWNTEMSIDEEEGLGYIQTQGGNWVAYPLYPVHDPDLLAA